MKYPPYPRYKPTSVQWLGPIPQVWDAKRLKYLATINDETLREETDPNYELTYVDISSVDASMGIVATEELTFENAPSRARRKVRDGDTIVSTVRTYLRAIAPIKAPSSNLIVSTGFAVVRPQTVDSSFLSYALREARFIETVVARSVGVSYPAVNSSDVATIPIVFPSLDEQRLVAGFLDRETGKIDTLIKKKHELIEKLTEKRTALVSQTVTRGLPPDAARAAGIDPHTKFKPSGIEWLGNVPDGWTVLSLKRIVKIPLTDGPHETPDFPAEGIPFVSAEAIWGGKVHLESRRGFISEEAHREYARKVLPRRNDIFIVKSGSTTGKVAIVDFDDEFNIWSPLAVVRCDPKINDPRFMFYALSSTYFQGVIQVSWSFGTQPNIGMAKLNELPVLIAPIKEQLLIASFLDREASKIDRLIEKVQTASERLREYRTALITATVTGKIDVRKQAA